MARTPICKFALAFPKVVSAWFESARGMSVSVARRERRRETSRWRRARRARLRLMDVFFRSSGRTDIAPRSGNNRHEHAATPRTREERTAGRRAGRRVAFRGRKEGDVPGDHSSLAICTLVYSVVPLGTAPARKGGSSVGRRSARRRCATRERGGGRTARLTREREDRQRRDRLSVSGGRPRLRHGRLSGARARGAPAPHRARRSAASTGVSPASSRAETSAPSPASALTASPAPFTAAQ